MQWSYRPSGRYSLSLGAPGALLVTGLFALHATRAGLPQRLWAHVAYGRWIIENQDLSEADPLSPFTHPSNTFIDPSWLSRVVLAGACRLGENLAGADETQR